MFAKLRVLSLFCILTTLLFSVTSVCIKKENNRLLYYDLSSPAIVPACFGYDISQTAEYIWPAAPQKTRLSALRILRDNQGCQEKEETFRLSFPKSVTAGGDGKIYVIDKSGVLLFDDDTKIISRFANMGLDAVTDPRGITLSEDGSVYIIDGIRKTLRVYSSDNLFLTQIGAGDFVEPSGVVLDEINGWIYVSDKSANSVKKFSLAGVFISEIVSGAPGSPDELNRPGQMAVNSRGELLVLHLGVKAVNVYSSSGAYLFSFGEGFSGTTSGPFSLNSPKGVAIDSEDNVYITDARLDKLQIYSPAGKIRMMLLGTGSLPGKFSLPTMISIDSADRLYIAEYGGERIQMFQIHSALYEMAN